jgi:hypothetical protein
MLAALFRNRRGSAIVEFAVLAPVMILLISGTIESAHIFMVKIALQGAVETAARESVVNLTISEDARDAKMRARIASLMSPHHVAPGGTLTIDTRVYRTLGSAYPEAFEDSNSNGTYDEGESFDDRNHNGVRDLATAVTGKMGDVGDVVAYEVTFPIVPYFSFLSPIFGEQLNLTTATVSRNEPEKGVV